MNGVQGKESYTGTQEQHTRAWVKSKRFERTEIETKKVLFGFGFTDNQNLYFVFALDMLKLTKISSEKQKKIVRNGGGGG